MNFFTDVSRTPPKAIGLAVLHFVILLTGLILGSAKYDDWDFAPRYVPTMLVATTFIVALTFLLGRERTEIGFRAPEPHDLKLAIPGALIVVAGIVAFASTWAKLPSGASIDGGMMARTFLVAAMVGFTEEWMFRGLILTVLVRWLGFRNGTLAAVAAFGVFHIGNIAAGAPVVGTLKQVVFAACLGLTFVLIVLATRSLFPAMIAHALYDFSILGSAQLEHAGAEKSVIAGSATILVGIVAGVIAIRHVSMTTDTEPYPAT